MANTAFEHSPTITVPGSGNSTDNAVVLWNGTTGNNFSNSVVIINSGAVTGVTTLAASTSVTSPIAVLTNGTNAYTITLNTGTTAANYTITLPAALPGAAGKILQSSGGSPHSVLVWADAAAIVPTTIAVLDTTDTTTFVGLWTDAAGDLAPKTDAALTYNAGTGLLSAAGVTASGTITFGTLSDGTIAVTAWVDEDNMSSNSATLIPTQQSVKAYVDNLSTGTSWQAVKTSAFDADAGEGYPVNTSSGAITCTLPSSADVGDTIQFVDYSRTFSTNNLTLNQNSLKFQGDTTPNPVYDTVGQSITIVYVDPTQGWIPTSDDDVTDETTPQPYSVDYLVIAGGGSGGVGASSGGGGAGGYRNSYSSETSGGGGSETAFTAVPGTIYTVVIGGGGVGSAGSSGQGTASSIIGSSVSKTTVGGGDGGDRSNSGGAGGNDGATGGSGGGGGSTTGDGHVTDGGAGTSNEGYAGGTGKHLTGYYEGGGGGGSASQAGNNSAAGQGGAGGNGLSSSITGSAVTRGGGGGATGNTAAGGGTGGGGAGGGGGSAGTPNTGGGGGGGTSGGNGGSGVVIIRMATANYSGTRTGSPGVTTSGSDTILTFNANGTYTG